MSVQSIVDKENNTLLVTGVLKGSKFIKSGMDLLTPEQDEAHTAEGVQSQVIGERDKRANPFLAHASDVQIVWSRAKSTPFYDLIAYVFQKVQFAPVPSAGDDDPAIMLMLKGSSSSLAGQEKARDPPSSILAGLSNNHKELYKAALDELRRPGPVEAKKDVQVMQSGIMNTVIPSGRSFTLSKNIMASSHLPPVDPQSDIHIAVTDLLKKLLDALYPTLKKVPHADPQFVQLQKAIWQGLCHAVDLKHTESGMATYTTLLTMQHIVAWVELGSFRPPISEHVFVSQKKSVRLNAVILVDLEARVLDLTHHYPVIAEGKGLSMDFYALKRYGDVLGVGRATVKGIILPSDISDLKTFLQSGSMLTLFAFRPKATPFGDGDGDCGYCEEEEALLLSPVSYALQRLSTPRKRSNPFILFSPAKKDKRNQGRRRSLAEENDELEDEDEYEGHN
ncbi:hypothetical protein BGZ58_008494 [Dissophora ornata]|nr:hypothetical protein BGZ58_008494 [Dissophora ornata]